MDTLFIGKVREIEATKAETKLLRDVSQILEELIAQRKAETALYEEQIKVMQAEIDRLRPKFTAIEALANRCVFDNLSPEDRLKPLGLVCYCRKCTPYSM